MLCSCLISFDTPFVSYHFSLESFGFHIVLFCFDLIQFWNHFVQYWFIYHPLRFHTDEVSIHWKKNFSFCSKKWMILIELNGCKWTFNDFILLEYHLSKNLWFKYHLTPKISFKHCSPSKNLVKASKNLFKALFKATKNLTYIKILI